MWVYKNTKSTFTGWIVPADCVYVSDEDYEKLLDGLLVWENDKLINNGNYTAPVQNNELEIAVLKQQLADSDYKAIKYAEGLISEEDYASIKAERQALRDRINSLSL